MIRLRNGGRVCERLIGLLDNSHEPGVLLVAVLAYQIVRSCPIRSAPVRWGRPIFRAAHRAASVHACMLAGSRRQATTPSGCGRCDTLSTGTSGRGRWDVTSIRRTTTYHPSNGGEGRWRMAQLPRRQQRLGQPSARPLIAATTVPQPLQPHFERMAHASSLSRPRLTCAIPGPDAVRAPVASRRRLRRPGRLLDHNPPGPSTAAPDCRALTLPTPAQKLHGGGQAPSTTAGTALPAVWPGPIRLQLLLRPERSGFRAQPTAPLASPVAASLPQPPSVQVASPLALPILAEASLPCLKGPSSPALKQGDADIPTVPQPECRNGHLVR